MKIECCGTCKWNKYDPDGSGVRQKGGFYCSKAQGGSNPSKFHVRCKSLPAVFYERSRTMSDYIKKEDAREAIRETCRNLNYLTPPVSQLTTAIDKVPSDDVELVRHGHWEQDGHHVRCSECGTYFCITDREGDSFPINYCPCCGAKMDEKEEEHE